MTIMFNAVFGIYPGYDFVHLRADDRARGSMQPIGKPLTAEEIVAESWKKFMALEWEESNILVSATCTGTKVVYPEKFGCPTYGEVAVEVQGVLNPKFGVVDSDWKDACVRIVKQVKAELQQERVTLYFQQVESLIYLE